MTTHKECRECWARFRARDVAMFMRCPVCGEYLVAVLTSEPWCVPVTFWGRAWQDFERNHHRHFNLPHRIDFMQWLQTR